MKPVRPDSIRAAYQQHGTAAAFYAAEGEAYRNPHEDVLRQFLPDVCADLDTSRVLDLSAGSGEVTLALRDAGVEVTAATDPFTFAAYEQRVGRPCARWGFEQLAAGEVAEERFSLVICSFALHLCSVSRLPGVCAALARMTNALLIVTPHKRPALRESWGWTLTSEQVHERVRFRLYHLT